MPLDQRKTEMDDTPSESDVMDDLVNDMQVTSDIQDNAFADRVYTRFLSVPGPGVVTVPVFPWVIDKRKTGTEDTPSVSEILQVLPHELQTAYTEGDDTASDRIYNRFLSQMETVVVSRYFLSLPSTVSDPHPPQTNDWNRPHPRPTSHM